MPSIDVVLPGTVSSFPQTGANHTLEELAKRIARYAGGQNDPSRVQGAKEAIQEAVNDYNAYCWGFNRVVQDITLTAGGATPEYTLTSTIKQPERMKLLDTNSNERDTVDWFPFEEFIVVWADRKTPADPPLIYTTQNVFETGKVLIHPTPNAPSIYPKVRLYFHRFIEMPSDAAALNVPRDVQQGILLLAKAYHLASIRGGMDRAKEEFLWAFKRLEVLEQAHRAFADFIGAAG